MPRDDEVLIDIVNACRLVVAFSKDATETSFRDDLKTQSAVLHQLLIIGEAAGRLSEAFRAEHPEMAWREIVSMRNRLIHEYQDVNVDIVWKTVCDNVPELLAQLEPLAPNES